MTDASISGAEYNELRAAAMTERQLQDVVTAAAYRAGWISYHTHDSRRSAAGYPDLHLVNGPLGISIFRELKTMKGTLTADQRMWIRALRMAGVDADVWRPIDWFDGTIDKALAGVRP